MFCRVQGLVALTIALGSAPLMAHELWIEPSTFSPKLGESVAVRLRVGEHLKGEPLPLIPRLVNQFVVQEGVDRKPIGGRRGSDPAGLVQVAQPGLHIVGYQSNPSAVELAADKFNTYLVDEGLDAITALRARRNETNAKARELFSRCAKSLLLSGPPSQRQDDRQQDRPLGCPVELVAERNPYTLRVGQDMPVRLTYHDQPLKGALVVAMNSVNPADRQVARTDVEGRARFKLHPGGMWLVKAVHMVALPSGGDAQWESFWASLTFETQAPGL
jgi:uncharacterized GH25 family protein